MSGNQTLVRPISQPASHQTDSRADGVVSVNKRCWRDGPQMVLFTLSLSDKHHYGVWQPPSPHLSRVKMSHQSLAPEQPKKKPQRKPTLHQLARCHVPLQQDSQMFKQVGRGEAHLTFFFVFFFPAVVTSGDAL